MILVIGFAKAAGLLWNEPWYSDACGIAPGPSPPATASGWPGELGGVSDSSDIVICLSVRERTMEGYEDFLDVNTKLRRYFDAGGMSLLKEREGRGQQNSNNSTPAVLLFIQGILKSGNRNERDEYSFACNVVT